MGLECGQPCPLPPPVARTESKYLDTRGNHVRPDKAVKVITITYDAQDHIIETTLLYDPTRPKPDRK